MPPPRHPASAVQPVYESFVGELASGPDRDGLLDRLTRGHQPDEHGWCAHPGHSHRWESHPCPVLRLAALVADADGQSPQAPRSSRK